MGNSAKQPRSFNTIRKTQTKERARRGQMSRVVLLLIFAVCALIVLSLVVLGICSIADAIAKRPRPEENKGGGGSFPAANVRYDTYFSAPYTDTHKGPLILVNRTHRYELFDYTNGNVLLTDAVKLVNIYNNRAEYEGASPYQVLNRNELMEKTACEAFNRMMVAYFKSSGKQDIAIALNAAYRDYDAQAHKNFPQGYSDHHTGYCVALTAPLSGDGIKKSDHTALYNDAPKYGFVVRYPNNKFDETKVSDYEYCFRYVGVAHATYMTQKGYCMEEYLELLRTKHTVANALKITGADGNHYEVYYIPAVSPNADNENPLTQFLVPSNYSYTVSGDNCGGFIVTVNVSNPVA